MSVPVFDHTEPPVDNAGGYSFGIEITVSGLVLNVVIETQRTDPSANPVNSINYVVRTGGQYAANSSGGVGHGLHLVEYTASENSGTCRFAIPREYLIQPAGPCRVTVMPHDVNTNTAYAEMIYVVTIPERNVPAFAPGTIVRSLFTIDVSTDLQADPNLLPQLKAAGINCLELPCFTNPADGYIANTLEELIAVFESVRRPGLDYAIANDMLIAGIGDDFIRTDGECAWVVNTPWSSQAIAYVSQQFRDTGRCVGIEVVDEAGHLLDPAFPIRKQALDIFTAAWKSVPNAPPLSFPDVVTPNSLSPFEQQGYSDYSSRFWRALNWGRANGYVLLDMTIDGWGIVPSTSVLPLGNRLACLLSVAGPHYIKRVPGDHFQEGDEVINWGMRPSDIIAQGFVALASGTGWLRGYFYEYNGSRVNKGNAPIGTIGLQTGVRPGDERFAAMSVLFNAIQSRQNVLMGEWHPAVVSGPMVIGSRAGAIWGVNCSESPVSTFESGTLITPDGEVPFTGGMIPPGGVLFITGTH